MPAALVPSRLPLMCSVPLCAPRPHSPYNNRWECGCVPFVLVPSWLPWICSVPLRTPRRHLKTLSHAECATACSRSYVWCWFALKARAGRTCRIKGTGMCRTGREGGAWRSRGPLSAVLGTRPCAANRRAMYGEWSEEGRACRKPGRSRPSCARQRRPAGCAC